MVMDRTDRERPGGGDDYRVSERHVAGESGASGAEEGFAWVLGIAALGLGAIGLLVGFGVVDSETTSNATIQETASALGSGDWMNGMLWLIPGVSAAFLAMGFHRSEHHRYGASTSGRAGRGLFGMEHALAYLFAASAIAAGALALLAGYDVFDRGNGVEDGLLWGAGSVICTGLASMLHPTRQHELAAEEDWIVQVVQDRMPRSEPVRTTAPRTVAEPRRDVRD
jgi:hypothetical protein